MFFASGYAQFYYWIQQLLYEAVIVTVLSNKIQLLYVCFKINGRFDRYVIVYNINFTYSRNGTESQVHLYDNIRNAKGSH
jgi:hypothetical protein